MIKFIKKLFCFHEYKKLLFWEANLINHNTDTKETIETPVCFICEKCGRLKYFYHYLVEEKDLLEFKQQVRELLKKRK